VKPLPYLTVSVERMAPTMVNRKTLPSDQKKIDPVERQIVLPFMKSVEISLKSLRVRFLRSFITTMSLVLAVSFLSFVRVGNDIADGLLAARNPQLREAVVRAGYDLGPTDTSVSASAKQRWIIILSLLVCVVGIINAQLMAVTERFREIGTMKCLGALDRFILRLFILEAAMQGLAGAGAGALAGAFFAIISGLLRYGFAATTLVSWLSIAVSVAVAIGVGCLLSLLGVLYPALVAARMQPVEAMRVEQ
jgi:putative ABC transport system permease protein